MRIMRNSCCRLHDDTDGGVLVVLVVLQRKSLIPRRYCAGY